MGALKVGQDEIDHIQAELDHIFESMAITDEAHCEEGDENRGISEEEFVNTFLGLKAHPESKEVMTMHKEMNRQSTLLKSQMMEMQYMLKALQGDVRSMRDELTRRDALGAWIDG